MTLKLYVVHGSHPCAAVQKALSMKGLDYSVVEWPPPLACPAARADLFGARTVPGLKIDGEKVQGSRAIMQRLDELVPEPPLCSRRTRPAAPPSRRPTAGATRCSSRSRARSIWAGLLRQSRRDGQLQRALAPAPASARGPPQRAADRADAAPA